MLLGISPTTLNGKPPAFKPWLSSRCVAWFDATNPANTNDGGGLISAVPSMADPTKILTGAGVTRALLNATGILGAPAFQDQTLTTSMQSASQVIPASPYFVYGVASLGSGSQSFGSIWSGNSSFLPLLTSNGGGSNQIKIQTGTTYISAITYGTPKRYAVSVQGDSSKDKLQWGANVVTGAGLGVQTAVTGFCLYSFYSNSASTHMQGFQSFVGIFSGDPATGGLFAALDAYVATRGYTGAGAALFT